MIKPKRVEYQKFVRTKLEQERYRGLFGLTDNITLESEEDLVLQREFRIDFILQKTNVAIPLTGIFSHFKQYNLLEFKSVNDPLTAILLIKYIGQLFWWLFAKNTEAKENRSNEIREDEITLNREDEITLNIVTVGRPRNVINKLDKILVDRFIRHGGGHYQYDVQGVEVHLFVINEFPVEREYYAWLIFSEGKKYEKFMEKLAQEIEDDEKFQVYLELISELEKEGKEKMAYEILQRIFSELPVEQQEVIYSNLLVRNLKEGREKMAYDILRRVLSDMSVEQQQKTVTPDVLKGILSEMPADTLKSALSEMPAEKKQEIIEYLQQ